MSGSQTAGASQPFARPFSFCIKHVQYSEDPAASPTDHGADPSWRPSASARFTVTASSGWWMWDPGLDHAHGPLRRVRRPTAEEGTRLRRHRTCSMIWDPERHGYIQVPIDCTTTNISSTTYMWRRLSFGPSHAAGRAQIALVGHLRENTTLHLPAPTNWFEQLLPDIYRSHMDGPASCRLAGHLSLLVGLVAFSAVPAHDVLAIDRSFRYDVANTTFRQNPLPKSPMHQKRGMVIEIGFDPYRVSAEQLRAWEDGEKGAIFS